MRLRAALRFAGEPSVETILREVIASAEDRLLELERSEQPKGPEVHVPEGRGDRRRPHGACSKQAHPSEFHEIVVVHEG
jgi:hypothetical protein